MIFKYFRGIQSYVSAASHITAPQKDMKLSTWIGTSLKLSENKIRRRAVSDFIGTLEGRTVLICKTLNECEHYTLRYPNSSVFYSTSSAKNRLATLERFFAQSNAILIVTDSMFKSLVSCELHQVDNVVLLVYGNHKANFIHTLRKFNPKVLYHIVDNVNAKGIIPKVVANIKEAGIHIDVDRSTLDCFKFDRSLDKDLSL